LGPCFRRDDTEFGAPPGSKFADGRCIRAGGDEPDQALKTSYTRLVDSTSNVRSIVATARS